MAEKKEPKAEAKAPAIEKVPVYIPKKGPGDDARYLAVNGKRIMVKTNTHVMLEKKFAEVYYNSIASDEAAQAYIEANAK